MGLGNFIELVFPYLLNVVIIVKDWTYLNFNLRDCYIKVKNPDP